MRLFVAALALSLGAAAHAQTTFPSAQQVQLLAPQLVPFSGSTANFESLVSGLTAGTPVTLTTLGADGTMQIATFLPGLAMSAADAARTLETARQSLIARGIATPNAQQLAVALMGGTLTNGFGTSGALPGILTGTISTSAVQLRNERVSVATPGLGQLAQQGIVDPTPTLQGVLQPGVRSTSESPFFGTSNSSLFGTSNTPPSLNPIVTPAPVNPAGVARPSGTAPTPIRPGARPGG